MFAMCRLYHIDHFLKKVVARSLITDLKQNKRNNKKKSRQISSYLNR